MCLGISNCNDDQKGWKIVTLHWLPSSEPKDEAGTFSIFQNGENIKRHDWLLIFHSTGLISGIIKSTGRLTLERHDHVQLQFWHISFEVMPLGLMNSQATFERIMNEVQKDRPSPWLFGRNSYILKRLSSPHWKCITIVERISRAGLRLKFKNWKYAVGKAQLPSCLKRRIIVDFDWIRAIAEDPSPQSKTELCSFSGLASCNRRFIKNLARISAPIQGASTRRKDQGRINQMNAAYAAPKTKLCELLVLPYPILDKLHLVKTDSPSFPVGDIQLPKDESRKVNPVQFASRIINTAEQNYTCSEKEALAVVLSLKKLRLYFLLKSPHQIRTIKPCAPFLRERMGMQVHWDGLSRLLSTVSP